MALTVKAGDWQLLEALNGWFAGGRVADDFAKEHEIPNATLTSFQRRYGLKGKRNVGLVSIITGEPFPALVEQGLFEQAPVEAPAGEAAVPVTA